MNETPLRYEIRVRGHLAPRRLCCFEGLTILHQNNGETVLTGPVRDQSALYGLLSWLQNMGVPLLSVRQLGEDKVTNTGHAWPG
jgi:hypothetical protein